MADGERKATSLINVLLATKTVLSVVITKDTFKLSAIVVMEAIEVYPHQEDVGALHKQAQQMKGMDQELDMQH